MCKRLTACVLVLAMLIMPIGVFAEEPSSTGDGLMPYEDVLRLIRWIDDDYAWDLTYEDVVAFTGVEGKDDGHQKGVTSLGDHYFDWIAEEDQTHYIHVCFRGREDSGRYELCQWNTSAFDSSEWENADISDWLSQTAATDWMTVSQSIQRFSNPAVTVYAQIPASGWTAEGFSDNQYNIGRTNSLTSGIRIKVFENVEMFDFYVADYTNIHDGEDRTIAGNTVTGRNYTYMGHDWAEYVLVMDSNVVVGVQVNISDEDLTEGTEAATILDSLAFSFTDASGWECIYGELPASAEEEYVDDVYTEEGGNTILDWAFIMADCFGRVMLQGGSDVDSVYEEDEVYEEVYEAADGFVGHWYAIYIHTGAMDMVPSEYGLAINLVLDVDGSAWFDYPSYEESTWSEDADGITRYDASGTPLSLQSDGTLLYGSYLSGYMIFATDPNAVATVFPEEVTVETNTEPQQTETAEPVTEEPKAAGGDLQDYIGKKYTATSFEASGYTMDASSLGAEYSVTLHDDHTATLFLAGTELSGMAWTESENGVTINYYGIASIDITFNGEEILMNYMDAMLLHMEEGA